MDFNRTEAEATKNTFSRKEMKRFAEHCRNGLNNVEYNYFKLEEILQDWEKKQIQ